MHHSPSRQAGDQLIADQARSQVRTFFDELKNGTRNYQTVASLDAQIAQEYRGRCILELLQNAHDALANGMRDDPRRISFVLKTDPEPVLLVGNSGLAFRPEDFKGICQLAQSPKDPNESVGNKGLGFRSVLEVSGRPEIWSTTPPGGGECFAFRFDPAAVDKVAEAAQELKRRGLNARSPFDSDCPLVDWSRDQLDQYQQHLAEGIDAAHEARKFLSPYSIPLPADGMPSAVRRLLDEGHATVVRLPLDGGRMLAQQEAVKSVEAQLKALRDARAVIFLEHLAALVVEVNGERRVLNRTVDSEASPAGDSRTRQRRLRVSTTAMAPGDARTRQFRVWTRVVGGDDDPKSAKNIHAAVKHLPNRWPDVRQATLGVAVEDASTSAEGVFVIFLPTEKTTGTGAHVNAPFYGSLDRREIDFHEPYNELLLEAVLDLCLDAVHGLAAGQPKRWRARAILDILSSLTVVGGEHWSLIEKLRERAVERDRPLDDQALILCDDGWRTPVDARVMPDIDSDDPIGVDRWREYAGFAVVSKKLDDRKGAIRKLINALGGKPGPTHPEWVSTIERMARWVRGRESDLDWNDFLRNLLDALPNDLRSKPRHGPDPLADAHFLPTSDVRLVAASDSTKLFFQPVQGIDDVADLVEDVPEALRERVAFLHPDVQTHEEGRNTEVQEFLAGRFALSPRREDILRNVVVPALPSLPAPHGSSEADCCAAILAWTLKLLGDEPPDTSLQHLGKLPVACHAGWRPMVEAVFGPGWPDRLGDDLQLLADQLPDRAAERLNATMLLPPDDERWPGIEEGYGDLFARAGVVAGLRPLAANESFYMNHIWQPLPDAPAATTKEVWSDWFEAVKGDVRPPYTGSFKYEFRVQLLSEIHYLAKLKSSGRLALSRLILASLGRWDSGWESVNIRKAHGQPWSKKVVSPLKHWLRTLAWLSDRPEESAELLSRRWLVPESLLRGQSERYSHLDPLSPDLAHRLNNDSALQKQLVGLGLNVYPTEEDRTGPELLDALAKAWATVGRVPSGRFDVFLGQVRDAWRHLDPDRGLPTAFLVRTGQREFSTCGANELMDVYLPDSRDRTRALQEHGKAILEMHPAEAQRLADALTGATDVRRASRLKERHVIDGVAWLDEGQERSEAMLPLEETQYHWLPVVLLSVAAHGGNNPTGATTKAWRDAVDRLRRTRLVQCGEIVVELVHDDRTVGLSEPRAQWLPGDVLAVRRDIAPYEELAAAAQALLERQDLLKDLRLVLGALSVEEEVTTERIELALARAEIDSGALADIRQRWAGNTSFLADRIRPVLVLFGIPGDGLDAAAVDIERLTEWLSTNLTQWPTSNPSDLLEVARTSSDDHQMGMAAWKTLGNIAQLPDWNAALENLGYETVQNHSVSEQTTAHLEEAKALLRGLAQHVAVESGQPDLFHRIEKVSQNFASDADWARRWWEVPFNAILSALRDRYAEIPGVEPHLKVLEDAGTVDELRKRFEQRRIKLAPDPYDTADGNMKRLEGVLTDVHDLHQAWMELRTSEETRLQRPEVPAAPPAEAYLQHWSDTELLKKALEIIDDKEFTDACDDCSTSDAIRQRLDLTPDAVERRRRERRRREQEAERTRRTFDVAGVPFEVGGESYRDLFDLLGKLPVLEGPCARQDEFTPLAKVRTNGREGGGRRGGGTVPATPRPSADYRELIGIVGESRAYHYLRKQFGEEAVTRDAWVSEIRRKVLPPVEGEPDNVNDGHGFDFQFTHKRKKWHVEVKATDGDNSQFELGISEIKAANRLAQEGGGHWRILRIRHALSDHPKFDWLPNPFKDGSREYFRLHKGGMRVSYSRR